MKSRKALRVREMSAGHSSSGSADDVALVNRLFQSQTCKYKFVMKHDPPTGGYDIPVTLDSNALAPFPCELHELAYVLPNTTFLGAGSTFDGRPPIPSLTGGREDEVSGLVVKAADEALAKGGEERFFTIPKHSYSVSIAGLTEFNCQLSRDDAHLGGSEAPTLFASSSVRAFLAEALHRVAWMQTERSGAYRSLKLGFYKLMPRTLDPVMQTMAANDDDVVPSSVDFKRLSFDEAQLYAEQVHAQLEDTEKAMYIRVDDALSGDWSTPRTRAIVEARLALWQDSALDRSETPHLRSDRVVKARGMRNTAGDTVIMLKPSKNGVGDGGGGGGGKKPSKSKKVIGGPVQAPERFQHQNYKSQHVFFHTVGTSGASMQTRMLLKTSISYANRRDDRIFEEAQTSRVNITNQLCGPKMARIAAALTSLSIAFSQIPVFDPDKNIVAIGSNCFRRVAYLLGVPTVRLALQDAFALAKDSNATPKAQGGPSQTTKLRPRSDGRYDQALDLYEKMRELHAQMSSSTRTSIVQSPELAALTQILNKLDEVKTHIIALLERVRLNTDDAMAAHRMLDTDGVIDVSVQTSAYGEKPQSLNPAPAPPRRGLLLDAMGRGVLRLFYDPVPAAIQRYFLNAGQ